MPGPASKEVEEFIKAKVAQEIISKIDPLLISRLLQEIIAEEVNKIIGSYDLRKLAEETVQGLISEKIKEMTREIVNQPEVVEKIRQSVNNGVNSMIDKIDETVRTKLDQVLKYY
jgi:hypothetical protein